MHQVRRVLQQETPFLEGLHHERNISLLEITHSAMDQFGRAAGGAFSEITLLKQNDAVTARRCIPSYARAGGAAAYHRDVPRLFPFQQAVPEMISLHYVRDHRSTSGR